MRLSFTRLLALLVPAFAVAADEHKKADKPPALAGKYDCAGDNGNGSKYKGTVEITVNGDGYEVEWTIGDDTHIGVGIWENERLSCSWATVVNGKVQMGVVVYKREKDGTLTGKWSEYPGTLKLLDETLTPQKK
jgi:hypothetical protein